MRRVVLATAVLLFGVSFAVAEEFMAQITKVDGNKVTFRKFDFKNPKKGEEMTLPAADNVKVLTAKFNLKEKKVEPGDAIEGGLKADVFKAKEVYANIVTSEDGKMITEIRVFQGKGKKTDK